MAKLKALRKDTTNPVEIVGYVSIGTTTHAVVYVNYSFWPHLESVPLHDLTIVDVQEGNYGKID